MTASPINSMSPFVQATPMANSSAGNGDSNDQSSTITANDFLTLLVTEMQNQDPTAQTDPNEYINQLVQVNSLEQLIQINQNLSSALGTANAGPAASASGKPAATGQPDGDVWGVPDRSASASLIGGAGTSRAIAVSKDGHPATQGNLGIPIPTGAAQRVAQALSGSR